MSMEEADVPKEIDRPEVSSELVAESLTALPSWLVELLADTQTELDKQWVTLSAKPMPATASRHELSYLRQMGQVEGAQNLIATILATQRFYKEMEPETTAADTLRIE